MNDKLTDWEKAVARVIWPGIDTNDNDWTPEGRELLRKQSKKMLDLCLQPLIDKAISWLKEQDEIIGVSFQEDFLERFKNYMKGE